MRNSRNGTVLRITEMSIKFLQNNNNVNKGVLVNCGNVHICAMYMYISYIIRLNEASLLCLTAQKS
jgi:hypothetical protein